MYDMHEVPMSFRLLRMIRYGGCRAKHEREQISLAQRLGVVTERLLSADCMHVFYFLFFVDQSKRPFALVGNPCGSLMRVEVATHYARSLDPLEVDSVFSS